MYSVYIPALSMIHNLREFYKGVLAYVITSMFKSFVCIRETHFTENVQRKCVLDTEHTHIVSDCNEYEEHH